MLGGVAEVLRVFLRCDLGAFELEFERFGVELFDMGGQLFADVLKGVAAVNTAFFVG